MKETLKEKLKRSFARNEALPQELYNKAAKDVVIDILISIALLSVCFALKSITLLIITAVLILILAAINLHWRYILNSDELLEINGYISDLEENSIFKSSLITYIYVKDMQGNIYKCSLKKKETQYLHIDDTICIYALKRNVYEDSKKFLCIVEYLSILKQF